MLQKFYQVSKLSKVIKNKKLILVTGAFLLLVVVLFYARQNKDYQSRDEEIKIKSFRDFELSRGKNVCDILDYGAKEGGGEKNTEAIRKAIEDCHEKGGGKVVIPKGKWLTGSIHFKSNIELYLEKGAELTFSSDVDDYLPAVFSRFEGTELYNYSSLIYAKDCENIAITGRGKIYGNGEKWWHWSERQGESEGDLYRASLTDDPIEKRNFAKENFFFRPSFVHFVNCRNIVLDGFEITNGPMWTIHLLYSKNIRINDLDIFTSGPNTDGIVVDSSSNVLIENLYAQTGDDAIAIKSGADEEGKKINRPSEAILIKNCNIENGHSGLAIGSEMSGGVSDVEIRGCTFKNLRRGLRVKFLKGRGGYVKKIKANDVKMFDIEKEAIQITSNYGGAKAKTKVEDFSDIRDMTFENIECKNVGSKGIDIHGFSQNPVANIKFKNVLIDSKKGMNIVNAKDIKLDVEMKK